MEPDAPTTLPTDDASGDPPPQVELLGSPTAPELYAAGGLYTWTLTLANGSIRNVLASSMQSAIGPGNLPSPVVTATRGAAFNPATDTPPVLTSLTPPSAQVGAAPVTLHVNGTGFKVDSQILVNGVPVPTTFVSATDVSTPMATAGPARAMTVAVLSVAGQASNVLTFTLTP